jgi:hypothetical protein
MKEATSGKLQAASGLDSGAVRCSLLAVRVIIHTIKKSNQIVKNSDY